MQFTDVHGYRYPVCLTNLDTPDIAFLEALYRGCRRCGQAIRDLKATGLTHLPSAAFALNQAWLTAVLVAGDLLAWTRGLLLTGPLRRATAPRLRYALLHTAGCLVRSARHTTVRVPTAWPWASGLFDAVGRVSVPSGRQPGGSHAADGAHR